MGKLDYDKIGDTIKALRKHNNLTQRQLANKIYKTESSIRKYEKGLVEIPNSVLLSLAKALNTSYFNLTGLDEIEHNNIWAKKANDLKDYSTEELIKEIFARIKN